jgi:hypothetical protein
MTRAIVTLLLACCLAAPGCITSAYLDAVGGDAPERTPGKPAPLPSIGEAALLLVVPVTVALDLALSPIELNWWFHEELCDACQEREEEREERRLHEEEGIIVWTVTDPPPAR